jgi:hypothetical protein
MAVRVLGPWMFRSSMTWPDYFGKDKGNRALGPPHGPLHSKHGSWLNQAEIEISLFARQYLAKRRIPTLALLQRETEAWNAKPKFLT